MLKCKFKPKLTRMQVFGNPDHPIDLEFPTAKDLEKFPLDRKIKLKTILWKNGFILKGMQLKFTNDV